MRGLEKSRPLSFISQKYVLYNRKLLWYFIKEEKLMRTILKLKSKNKEEAINALKTAMEYLENDVTNDEIKIWYKLSKLTKIEKRMFL